MLPETDFQQARQQMVQRQLVGRGIVDQRVLDAMMTVQRHEFVAPSMRHLAYHDMRLPLGDGQMLSAPSLIAYMVQTLGLRGREKVLEIGTGSGYQTAILERLGFYVYSIEKHATLGERAGKILAQLNYHNVDIHVGDGSHGLLDMAPYDAIIFNAYVPKIPPHILNQLSPSDGRLVIPLFKENDIYLHLLIRRGKQIITKKLRTVAVGKLVGRYGFPPQSSASV